MITATIIQDSINNYTRITTFELGYPRFIHSELMTHRMFSRNAASSRAIPIATMNENISNNPAMPISWGINKPGMQATDMLKDVTTAVQEWHFAKDDAIRYSKRLAKLDLHKQIVNRVTEPFQHMKTVVTATEYDNWFMLRDHPDAQPEIQDLAKRMKKAMQNSVPQSLHSGQWHLPYIHTEFLEGRITYSLDDVLLTLEEAQRISVSCCAQVSYRKNDTSLEKADSIYTKLLDMEPFHASPFEHQATPMAFTSEYYDRWQEGVTHGDRNGYYWSGNFRGWIQYRQLLCK